jgi:hypothetical protein
MYARCGNSDFPQTVNNHSAEISENMEKKFKIKHNPNWIGNPEGVSGYPRDSEVYKSEEKGNRSKWPQRIKKPKITKGCIPSGVANFVLG